MKQHQIKKAIIPAAGFGTRMLPATLAVPKEMMPVAGKPIIQHVVESLVEAGIDEILIIISEGKESIKKHFSPHPELVQNLITKGKKALAEEIKNLSHLAKISFVYQSPLKGLGDAILYGEQFTDDESFMVLLGDNIYKSEITTSVVRQLVDSYYLSAVSTIGVQKVSPDTVSKYGILKSGEQLPNGIIEANGWVEKPNTKDAPSLWAVAGLYIFKPSIYNLLKSTTSGVGGEIQITDAMHTYAQQHKMYALPIDGKRYDIGNFEGFLDANANLP